MLNAPSSRARKLDIADPSRSSRGPACHLQTSSKAGMKVMSSDCVILCLRSNLRKFAQAHIIVAASSRPSPTEDKWIAGGTTNMGKRKTGQIYSKKEKSKKMAGIRPGMHPALRHENSSSGCTGAIIFLMMTRDTYLTCFTSLSSTKWS